MRLVILHYHILKNAGTTVEEILHRNFRERLLRFDPPGRDEEVTHAQMLALLESHPGVTAFSSHQIYYPVPQAPGFLFFPLCFLREPLDRIRSMYDYFRDKPSEGDPVSELASRVGLGEFTGHLVEEYPWIVNDVQVNLLANGMIHDQPKGLQDLERATERMLETTFLGVVDRFNESLIAGQHALRAVFPNLDCRQAPVNISGGMGSSVEARIEKFQRVCDPRIWQELVRMNQMDQELLRRARAEIDRRLQQVKDGERKLHALGRQIEELAASGAEVSMDAPVQPTNAPGRLEKARRLSLALPHRSALRTVFDAAFYLEKNPDVKAAGANPLNHYLIHGAAEDRKPHPLFNPHYYFSQCPEARDTGANPLLHFLESKAGERCNPHMLFDCESYERANPGLSANPLVHYLENATPAPAGPRLRIDDVEVPIALRAPEAGEALDQTAFVWPDAAGRTRSVAPPQQQPFFESVRYDQVAAQASQTISA